MLASISNLLERWIALKLIEIFIVFCLNGSVELINVNLFCVGPSRKWQIWAQSRKASDPKIILLRPIYNYFSAFFDFFLSLHDNIGDFIIFFRFRLLLKLKMRAPRLKHPIFGIIINIKFRFDKLRLPLPLSFTPIAGICQVICIRPLIEIKRLRLPFICSHYDHLKIYLSIQNYLYKFKKSVN